MDLFPKNKKNFFGQKSRKIFTKKKFPKIIFSQKPHKILTKKTWTKRKKKKQLKLKNFKTLYNK